MGSIATDGAADEAATRVTAIVGRKVIRMVPIDRGHIANRRYRAYLEGGGTIFVKESTNEFTKIALANERTAYESIGPQTFLPDYIGAASQTLVTQDLSHAHWPPTWRTGDVEAVVATLEAVGSVRGPEVLRDLDGDGWHHVWSRVAADPEPFLSLGVCDRHWFEKARHQLIASDSCSLAGAALVHGDIRSDNLCVLGATAIAVDWGAAARGRPDYDLTSLAIALGVEGYKPGDIAPRPDPLLVTVLAGTYAFGAASQTVPASIRHQLKRHLLVALPWCARLLGLPPPRQD